MRITSLDGRYFPPLGRSDRFPTADGCAVGGQVLIDEQPWAYIDGGCEIRLPSGPLLVELSKGPEYRPIKQEVFRNHGQIALRLAVEREVDLSAEGWYSGDTHARYLSPAAACLEGAAEGLSVVNLLAAVEHDERGDVVPGLLDFSGQKAACEWHGCQAVVNTLNRGGALGDLALLNAHRVIHPLELGQEGFEQYTLADWCQQCHRKGGLVVRTHFPRGDDQLADSGIYKSGIDVVEWTGDDPFEAGIQVWYTLLNQGMRVPLVGGSGKWGNGSVLGNPRTYAQIEPEKGFSYASWIEAIRIGRTFATRGPLLRFSVNGKGPGRVVRLDPGSVDLEIEATACGPAGCSELEVVANGQLIARGEAAGPLSLAVPAQGIRWLAARCWNAGRLAAHTSPVYIT
jgi:mono/diheme cytochrome c family protein